MDATVLVLAGVLTALPPNPLTTPPPMEIPLVGYAQWYGPPTQATLERLSSPLGDLQRRVVRTKGRFEQTPDGRYRLVDSIHAVLLIPVVEMEVTELRRFLGREAEFVGVSREIPYRQDLCRFRGQDVPESVCTDWLLPALPDRAGHPEWPLNSVTFWSIFEVGSANDKDAGSTASTLAAIANAPERFVGQTVTVEGWFRGGNLFGDLPNDTRRTPSDWVLSDERAALWVTGKPPSGDGFRLGLTVKEDARWWLEVTGKVEAGAVAYLRAKKVVLKKRGEPRPTPSRLPQASP